MSVCFGYDADTCPSGVSEDGDLRFGASYGFLKQFVAAYCGPQDVGVVSEVTNLCSVLVDESYVFSAAANCS